jgi:hypothetical protein
VHLFRSRAANAAHHPGRVRQIRDAIAVDRIGSSFIANRGATTSRCRHVGTPITSNSPNDLLGKQVLSVLVARENFNAATNQYKQDGPMLLLPQHRARSAFLPGQTASLLMHNSISHSLTCKNLDPLNVIRPSTQKIKLLS